MKYDLWRGDVQLGRFDAALPVLGGDITVGVAGRLEPLVAASELSDVWQMRDPFRPGIREISAPFGAGSEPANPSSRSVALEKEERAQDLPADRVLRITDDDGRTVPTKWISMTLETFVDDDSPDPPDGARESRTSQAEFRHVWMVSFVVQSSAFEAYLAERKSTG